RYICVALPMKRSRHIHVCVRTGRKRLRTRSSNPISNAGMLAARHRSQDTVDDYKPTEECHKLALSQ
ncbi:hypothetical protein, partial [Paraburkholderia hospita]|uniref:hypothetical protein n=1 Tax=Paraburkholderia hospita TaxID=169430 RepID=UPI001A98E786